MGAKDETKGFVRIPGVAVANGAVFALFVHFSDRLPVLLVVEGTLLLVGV